MVMFKEELAEKAAAVDALLERYLPEEEGYAKTIFSAMRYSVMAGGKRIRPLLMMETFRYFQGENEKLVEPFMAAIEMIHTYSLIHDDLPAVDNDDYRRGRLTSHKVYGEAMAILAGDALQSYAYEVAAAAAADAAPEDMPRMAQAMKVLTHKPGIYGMVGGQVVDVELTGKPIPEDVLHFIFELKTADMIEAAMMIGAILAGESQETVAQIEKAGLDIGMAFQIQDDILDETGDEAVLGKPVHSDEKNVKTTWVTAYGMEKAVQDVREYSDEAVRILRETGESRHLSNDFLFALIEHMVGRKR